MEIIMKNLEKIRIGLENGGKNTHKSKKRDKTYK